jgi:hypothetical protein
LLGAIYLLERPLGNFTQWAVDVPDMVAKFMESHEDIDVVREMRSF